MFIVFMPNFAVHVLAVHPKQGSLIETPLLQAIIWPICRDTR